MAAQSNTSLEKHPSSKKVYQEPTELERETTEKGLGFQAPAEVLPPHDDSTTSSQVGSMSPALGSHHGDRESEEKYPALHPDSGQRRGKGNKRYPRAGHGHGKRAQGRLPPPPYAMPMNYPYLPWPMYMGSVPGSVYPPSSVMPGVAYYPDQPGAVQHTALFDHHDRDHTRTTIYVAGLGQDYTDQQLHTICSRYGDVTNARAIIDKGSNQCKGYGFVQFAWAQEAQTAMACLRQEGWQVSYAKAIQGEGAGESMTAEYDHTNLYFANLPKAWNEQDMEGYLATYGHVVSSRILRDQMERSRGVGFARMENQKICERIIEELNNKENLTGGNQPLQVRFADSADKKQQKKEDRRLRQGYQDQSMYDPMPYRSKQPAGPNTRYVISGVQPQSQPAIFPPVGVLSPQPNSPWYPAMFSMSPTGTAGLPAMAPLQLGGLGPTFCAGEVESHGGAMQQLTRQVQMLSLANQPMAPPAALSGPAYYELSSLDSANPQLLSPPLDQRP